MAYIISSGITSNGITITSGNKMTVSNGGMANNTMVYYGGLIYVSSGGAVNSTMLNGGNLYVYNSGTAIQTILSGYDATMNVSEGGLANSTTVNNVGKLYVYNSGTANSTTVDSGGWMYVSSGGIADNTMVKSYGHFYVSSGGTANNTTVDSDGSMFVSRGGTATNITAVKGAALGIAVASNTYIQGTVDGRAFEMKEAFISGFMVNSGGWMYVSRGGTANEIIENGGWVDIEDGANVVFASNTISGLVLSYTSATVHSGTTANSTTVDAGGSLFVYNGGTANSTTINSYGHFNIYNGGTANSITVYAGYFDVSSDGMANSTTVNYCGSMFIKSGGTANEIIENGGFVSIGDGADVTFAGNSFSGITLSFYQAATVHSGTTANSTTVNSRGSIFVYNGGTANSTTVDSWGSMFVSSGGTANDTTVNIGQMFVSFGGYASKVLLLGQKDRGEGDIFISKGGLAEDVTVGDYGDYYVSSGGTANRTTVNSTGIMEISSGGLANSTTVNNAGKLYIYNGGSANEVIENGGFVDVQNGAKIFFASNSFSGTILNSAASATVHSGTTAVKLTLNQSGYLAVYSGGTATDLVWTPCNGTLWIADGAYVTYASLPDGVFYGGGGVLSSNSMKMEEITIQPNQMMYVMSNGIANSTTVSSAGIVYVFNGGLTNSTTVSSGGSMWVSSGGTANNTAVNSNGFMCVSSGGTAAHIEASSGARLDMVIAPDTYIEGTYADSAFEIKDGCATYFSVNSGNNLCVSSGGVASRTYIYSGGNLYVFNGGLTSRTVLSGGTLHIKSGGVANMTTMNVPSNETGFYGYEDGGSILVSSGGIAYDITLNDGVLRICNGGIGNSITNNAGAIFVSSGGKVDAITVRGGLHISSGGTATNITASSTILCFDVSPDTYIAGTSAGFNFEIKNGVVSGYSVNSGGYLGIYSGGTANSVSINGSGQIEIFSGGVANYTTINNNANYHNHLVVSSGGVVNFTTINNNGKMIVLSNAVTNSTMVNYGSMSVGNGAKANDLHINNGGRVWLYSGTVNDTTVNNGGSMWISSGGTASDLRINSGGYLYVERAKLTGQISIADGGTIQAGPGAVIDFDLSRLAPGMVPRVNNLSLIKNDAPAFTLTVSDVQWNGTYKLAQGVTEFDNLISVKSTASQTIHMVAVDETANVDGIEYTLKLTGDTLSVTVTGGRDIPIIPVSADNTDFTNQDVTLTAGFSDDAIMREYSFDNETWHIYTEPVKCAVNGIVYFLGKDQRGYVNEIGSYEVTNIDTTPPSKPSNQVSEVNGYKVDLSWSAASDTSGAAIKYEYRIATDNKYSQILNSGTTETCSVTIDNLKYGTYYWSVCATDAAGNASAWSLSKTFTTVDVVAPDTPVNLVCLVENLTTLSVSWDEVSDDSLGCGLNRYEIQLASDEAFDSIVKSLSTTETAATMEALSTGDYYLRVCAVDNAGNKSGWTAAEAFTIETDTIPPTISDIKADITEPTKENVTVTATFNDNYALETSQYKIGNDGEWTDYKNGVIVTENAVVYFRAVDTTGNETEASYEVKNIDRTKPVITLDGNSQTPVQKTTLTAATDDGSAILYRINNSGEWTTYTGTIAVMANASYSFKATDAAGNTGTAEITFKNIDTIPPVLTLTADTVTLSNSVTLTAETNEETVISYSSDNKHWTTYEGPFEVKANGRYYFKAVDVAGNVDNAEIEFTNIDVVAPTAPTGLRSFVDGQDVALVWNVSTDDFSGVKEYLVTYSLDGQEFTARTANSNYVLNNADFGSYNWSVQAVDFAGNESAIVAGDAFTISGFKPYTVEYSADNFEHIIRFMVTTSTLDSFRMPTGTYQLRVRQEGSSEWMTGDSIVAAEFDSTPKLIKSDADGNADVFFANPVGTWESCYVAQHVGSINDWAGTNEYASVFGKNKLADIIEGSTDANILLMTDDDNGDTLFVDDIYTASPGNMAEQQARIAQIDEIRAGSGNDIVDMTSQQFEYIGDGLTIRGGEGNDTIWANKGDNWLFGDAGNDRIVGASGNDVIAGGIGNDRMHGGGGNDIFTFCDNWGVDNVEQLATGSVILWFAEGSKNNWDEATLTYTDGDNSVKVSGVAAEKVTLKFGDDGSAQFASLTSMGAFFDATTERIFEENGKGILASL